MPSDQGRRHPQHHFGGFLGLALHRTKSRSSESLDQRDQDKKLDKHVLSSRDLTASAGFDNVLAELNKQAKFNESEEDPSASPVEGSRQRKARVDDTVPFSVKYAVAKNTATKSTFSTMSVAVMSPTSQTPVISTDGDPDMLDQALTNVRMKLVRN